LASSGSAWLVQPSGRRRLRGQPRWRLRKVAAMFAPPVAKTGSIQPQRSAVAAQRPNQGAVAQGQLLQRTIGDRRHPSFRRSARASPEARSARTKMRVMLHASPPIRLRPRGISTKSRSIPSAAPSSFKSRVLIRHRGCPFKQNSKSDGSTIYWSKRRIASLNR
jgi:hypothetical protein